MKRKYWVRLMVGALMLGLLGGTNACTRTDGQSNHQKKQTDRPVIGDEKRY